MMQRKVRRNGRPGLCEVDYRTEPEEAAGRRENESR